MDCAHCEPALLDLCYGELAAPFERDVRAHIAECPTCRKALSRLEAGQALARQLPEETAPPELTARILKQARSHARPSAFTYGTVQGWFDTIARVSMTRQVAMVTLSLLIVFVGLWSIPELTRRRETPGTLVVDDAARHAEAGPSRETAPVPALQPAAAEADGRLAHAKSAGTNRERSGARASRKADAPHDRAKRADRPAKGAADAADAADKEELALARGARGEAKVRPRPANESRFAQPPAADSDSDRLGSAVASTERRQQAAGPTETVRSRVLDRAAPGTAAESEPPRPEASGRTQPTAAPGYAIAEGSPRGSAPIGAAAPSPSRAANAAAVSGESQESAERDDSEAAASSVVMQIDDIFKAGLERYRASDFTAAAQLFSRMLESSAPSGQRAAALLYLGRSERAIGRCDRAIRAYETLVRSYGSAQQSSAALTEGVECYDRESDPAGAQRLLEHATSVPSLSTQATRALHDRAAPATNPR